LHIIRTQQVGVALICLPLSAHEYTEVVAISEVSSNTFVIRYSYIMYADEW